MATTKVARPVRSTRSTVKASTSATTSASGRKGKAKAVDEEDETEELARNMKKALKVSEPIPQASVPKKTVVKPAPARTAVKQVKEVKPVLVTAKPAASEPRKTTSRAIKDTAGIAPLSAAKAGPSRVASSSKTAATTRAETVSTVPPRVKAAPAVASRRTTATSKAPSKTAIPVPPKPSARSAAASTSQPKTTSGPTTAIPSRSQPSKESPKFTLTPLPHVTPPTWSLPDAELATKGKLAMATLNTQLRFLGTAISAGYKHNETKSVMIESKEVKSSEIEELVAICVIAVNVLIELDDRGLLGAKAPEVDKAGMGVVSRLIGLRMYQWAIEQLVLHRRLFMKRYNITPDPTFEEQGATSEGKKSGATPSMASKDGSGVPLEWLEVVDMPALCDAEEDVRKMCFQGVVCGWICLIGLRIKTESFQMFYPLPNDAKVQKCVHPIDYAVHLPITFTSSLITALYRQLITLNGRKDWLYIQRLVSATLASQTSVRESTARTPAQLWAHILKVCKSLVDSSHSPNDELRPVSETIRWIMHWVHDMLEARSEDKDIWHAGNEWVELMDYWIVTARKIGDRTAIKYALGLMTSSGISLAPSTPPSKPSSSTYFSAPETPVSDVKRAAFGVKVKGKSTDASAEVVRLCGNLAQIDLAVEQYLGNMDDSLLSAAAESALRTISLEDLTEAVINLDTSADVSKLLDKTSRYVERTRRRCVKILNQDQKVQSLNIAATEWLGSAVDLVEDLLGSPVDMSDIASDMTAGSLDSIITLAKTASTPQSARTVLNRAKHVLILARPHTSDSQRADWIRAIAASAYNLAYNYWKAESMEDAAAFGSYSCDLIHEALRTVGESDKTKSTWTYVDDVFARRYELVAVSLWKLQNKQAAVTAFWKALSVTSQAIIKQIEASSSNTPIIKVLQPLTDVSALLGRLVPCMTHDIDELSGSTIEFLERISHLPASVRGVVGERIIALLSEASNKIEVSTVCLEIGSWLLDVYAVEKMPIRRLRVLVRMMSIILQSGVQTARFDQLAKDAQAAAAVTNLAEDAGLQRFLGEYKASLVLYQALSAYHQEDQSCVLSLGRAGMAQLRALLIPQSSVPATPVKPTLAGKGRVPLNRAGVIRATPKARGAAVGAGSRVVSEGSKARTSTSKSIDDNIEVKYDDVGHLIKLLGSLASLLGVLGHVLAKIEALKLLRAVLRNQHDEIDEYIVKSGILATEYFKLGKYTKAKSVFSQAFRSIANSGASVSLHPRVTLYLRYAAYMAIAHPDELSQAQEAYSQAETSERDYETVKTNSARSRNMDRIETLERAALANIAMCAIATQQKALAIASSNLTAAYRLFARASDLACKIAPQSSEAKTEAVVEEDPFLVKPGDKGANERSKDVSVSAEKHSSSYDKKHLSGLHWAVAENFIDVSLLLGGLKADRGSVGEAEFYLKNAREIAEVLRSSVLTARADAKSAELHARMRQYETSLKTLDQASKILQPASTSTSTGDQSDGGQPTTPSEVEPALDGPDSFEITRIRGDVFAKTEMVAEAGEMFDLALVSVQTLEKGFNESESLIPTPKKLRASINAMTASISRAVRSKSTRSDGESQAVADGRMEVVLLEQLKKVWRQQAWLLREAGFLEDSEDILRQIRNLTLGGEAKAEDLWLDGKIGLKEAFDHFKTDLWMSSLTESTLAMPMGDPHQRTKDRRETRKSIQSILQRSEKSFEHALNIAADSGRIEDVRTACLSLALLRAFQTSLGEGSGQITASAADILACAPSITLQREIVEIIDLKFKVVDQDDIDWAKAIKQRTPHTSPSRKESKSPVACLGNDSMEADLPLLGREDAYQRDIHMRLYWDTLKAKYSSVDLLRPQDLSSLPPDWVVVSINVTDDRNTMFISRQQANQEPLVFTLPLDRQGKREGEAEGDSFTFDVGVEQFATIIKESDESSRNTKSIITSEAISNWWNKRYELDARMKELLATIEFCWLGAFKTILSPKEDLPVAIIEAFRSKLEKIFGGALSAGSEMRKTIKVHLDDTLLRTFATLSSKCKDEEVEDLVYFILDIYQFYGVQVALAELDIDQIGIDVKTALTEIEVMREAHRPKMPSSHREHLFLALDKNVSQLPWESIPILRGRAVSRVPNLPFLLDQVEMMKHINHHPTDGSAVFDGKTKINTNRVFYILNPGADLERTQMYFEAYLTGMQERGWKGIVGRSPTELEMVDALTNYDLVLYFGHGGAEQYIRSNRVKLLKNCAAVMLWGCSSGALKDRGDFDRSGTAWNYVLGGCPSLVANLWDVTDKDIDRLSEDVLKHVHLDLAHVPALPSNTSASHGAEGLIAKMGAIQLTEGLSSVQAVAKARDECRLKYLTGAAPVVYGLPMYLH